jgi:hypothetical protein
MSDIAAFLVVLRQLQKLNCQDFADVGVARRVVVTGLAGSFAYARARRPASRS